MDWSRSIHGVGDIHAGQIARERVGTMLEDVATLPTPALHLQIGDATYHGTPAEDRMALRWLGRLPGPYRAILGNHDILHNKRAPAAWARAYGNSSQNFTIDLPFVRIIAVGPDWDLEKEGSGVLSQATYAFLERELARAPADCWIACHWPLHRTVLDSPKGAPRRAYTSVMSAFYAKPIEPILALLARHANAKAWLSGHTHSPLNAARLITRAGLPGQRPILAVNLSALVGVGKNPPRPTDPICSLYLTHQPGKIEIRFRDHQARAWTAVGGRQVVSVRV